MPSHKDSLHLHAAGKRAWLDRTAPGFEGRRVRIFVATTIAPWAIVPAVALWVLLGQLDAVYEVFDGERYFVESLFKYLAFVGKLTIIGITIAYAATILIGVPTHIFLVLLRIEGFTAYLFAGSVGGFLVSLLVRTGLELKIFLVCCGASVAVAFWAIARPRL